MRARPSLWKALWLGACLNGLAGTAAIAQETTRIDLGELAGIEETLLVPITVGGALDHLHLHPHDVRAPGFALVEIGADGVPHKLAPRPVTTYRGELVGDPGSRVAASVTETGVHARVLLTGGGELWIEPVEGAAGLGTSLVEHRIYAPADLALQKNPAKRCTSEEWGGLGFPPASGGGSTENSSAGPAVAQLACDADYEFYSRYGSTAATSDRIESIVNTVNLQFERDVNVTHELSSIVVRTSGSQPYTGVTAVSLLVDLENEWNASMTSVDRDLAQLYTGKDLIGENGKTYNGSICGTNGYSVVESDYSGNFACVTSLTAHELGHAWGAAHCSCPGYTMYSSTSCENQFSSTSIYFISLARDALIAAGCLGSGGGGGGGGVKAPLVDRVFPSAGHSSGQTEVVVSGEGFAPGVTVRIDGVDQGSVTFLGSDRIRFTTTGGSAGPALLMEVENPDGGIATTAFTYENQLDPDPVSLSPNEGSTDGGETVTLLGAAFTGKCEVYFDVDSDTGTGGLQAASVSFVDSATLSVVTPTFPGEGVFNVMVIDPSTGQADVLGGAYSASFPGGGGGGGSEGSSSSGGGCYTRFHHDDLGPRGLLEASWWLAAILVAVGLNARRERARVTSA